MAEKGCDADVLGICPEYGRRHVCKLDRFHDGPHICMCKTQFEEVF